MVYNHLFFYKDRLSGVVVRTAQVIAINALRQIITDNPPIGVPAGSFSYGLLPQSGGAVSPPVSGEKGRPPIFSADSSNRTVRETLLPVLPKLLCLGFLPDIPPAGRGLTVLDQAKVLCQFLRRFFWERSKSFAVKSITSPVAPQPKQ